MARVAAPPSDRQSPRVTNVAAGRDCHGVIGKRDQIVPRCGKGCLPHQRCSWMASDPSNLGGAPGNDGGAQFRSRKERWLWQMAVFCKLRIPLMSFKSPDPIVAPRAAIDSSQVRQKERQALGRVRFEPESAKGKAVLCSRTSLVGKSVQRHPDSTSHSAMPGKLSHIPIDAMAFKKYRARRLGVLSPKPRTERTTVEKY